MTATLVSLKVEGYVTVSVCQCLKVSPKVTDLVAGGREAQVRLGRQVPKSHLGSVFLPGSSFCLGLLSWQVFSSGGGQSPAPGFAIFSAALRTELSLSPLYRVRKQAQRGQTLCLRPLTWSRRAEIGTGHLLKLLLCPGALSMAAPTGDWAGQGLLSYHQ